MAHIPPTLQRFTAASLAQPVRRKVAGYARVSTDSDAQFTSYEAQVDYYTRFIQSHDDWEFVSVYTDEGISGTNTRHREGFKRMVADALAGKIDLIVTKSVSRFARNTVDSLTTIRQLKEKGCECFFEKENIWTFDSRGELLITIMSSIAQEESRSISENTTWGHRKRFQDGKVSVPFKFFLGYDRGEDGNLVVNPEQAETVKLIFRLYLSGYSFISVARELTSRGIPTPRGKQKWSQSTVMSILTNEKYKGDALLQKCYTVDFLTKKQKKNHGEIPQYYVEGNHEAIIEPALFDMVQEEIARRSKNTKRYSGVSIFASKIKCGCCGDWFGAKVWHSNDAYRRVIYRCNSKYKGGEKCTTPHVTEDEIKALFLKAVSILLGNREELIGNIETALKLLCSTEEQEKEMAALHQEMELLVGMIHNGITENARTPLKQDEYKASYKAMTEKYDALKERYEEIAGLVAGRKAKAEGLRQYIARLREMDTVPLEFDESLWSYLIQFVTVYGKDDIRFTFKDSTEIPV